MRKTTSIYSSEIPHPNSEQFEKVEFGKFVHINTLLPPSGHSVLVKFKLYENKLGCERECLADAKFFPDSGWKIFDSFFEFPSTIDFSVIAWTWNQIGGKPAKFTIKNQEQKSLFG